MNLSAGTLAIAGPALPHAWHEGARIALLRNGGLVRLAAALAIGTASMLMPAAAQTAAAVTAPPAPANVAQLSATGTVEVQQDLLTVSLSTSRDGSDAAAVQQQLRQALETALSVARPAVVPGQMEARSGRFSLQPRYSREGRINGWTGSAELLLEGRDIERVSATAGRINSLTLSNLSFSLSRERRLAVEAEAQAQAIERFKQRATEVARAFGFAGYTVREVMVDNSYAPPGAPPMMMQARAAAVEGPMPAEAGKTAVVVTVSGSVQMRP